MDIDKLFKVRTFVAQSLEIYLCCQIPRLPTGGNKRKMPDAPTPEMLKKIKMERNAQEIGKDLESGQVQRQTKPVTVEDVEDAEEVDRGFAPAGDADYFAEEDEEGRFFGGGLTAEQKEILNIFDKATGDDVQEDVSVLKVLHFPLFDFTQAESLSTTSIKRMLLRFERAIDKNQDQRSKYPDDPTKWDDSQKSARAARLTRIRFIDSEADLDSAIKSLLPLSQVPSAAYPELFRSGSLARLIGLLAHENVDIVIDVVELINELTDEDAGNEDEETVEETEDAMKILVDGLVGFLGAAFFSQRQYSNAAGTFDLWASCGQSAQA